MFGFIYSVLHWINNFANGLDRTQWVMVMLVVLAVGCMLLRGMGSRSAF